MGILSSHSHIRVKEGTVEVSSNIDFEVGWIIESVHVKLEIGLNLSLAED